ncbi:MAG: phosphatidylglycerophosphatase [Rhodobacteraceae bacterium]|nr:phosphatidylglycerophosphatase [Paracoccaceae bacterium]
MDTFSDTWMELFGLAGLLNPLTLVIGAIMGWKADQGKKLLIAAFAAAVLSLLIETAWMLLGLPTLFFHDAGALAVMPFRIVSGGIVACIFYLAAKRLRA